MNNGNETGVKPAGPFIPLKPIQQSPHCKRPIDEDSQRCPHCGNYISEEDVAQTSS